MASIEMLMPKMGESIIEGTVLTWLKKEGDSIEQDESVLEVATDKVDTEVPATHAGILKKILAKEGDIVAVGAPIAIIETAQENGALPTAPKKETAPAREELITAAPAHTAELLAQPTTVEEKPSEDGRFYSPLVLSLIHI